MEKESNQKICLKSGISTNQKKEKEKKKNKTKIGEATTGNLTQLLKKQLNKNYGESVVTVRTHKNQIIKV